MGGMGGIGMGGMGGIGMGGIGIDLGIGMGSIAMGYISMGGIGAMAWAAKHVIRSDSRSSVKLNPSTINSRKKRLSQGL